MIQKTTNFETFANNTVSFNAVNVGAYIAVLYASYVQNGKTVHLDSGAFSLFFSRELTIPSDATDLHLYALISDETGQWIPVYNNNFKTAQSVSLKLYGTIFSPQAGILNDPDPTKLKVSATNNAGFVVRYRLSYVFNNLAYTMDSQNFTLGLYREIAIPNSATNVSVLAELFSGSAWIEFYNKTIPNNSNLTLTFTGTATAPQYKETITPPSSGGVGVGNTRPVIIVAKKPHKNFADLNDTITFVINVSNNSSVPAKDVTLKETLSSGLQFIPESFKINGVTYENVDPSSSMINLGEIQKYSSLLVTYQVKIISLPSSNKFMDAPILMFNYLDSNNSMQTLSITGSVLSLSTGDTPTPPCCCCCCCQPTP